MILQYKDELKNEGFRTETKKKFLFGEGVFVADLYAEKDEEKRIYDFQLPGKKEEYKERTSNFNSLAESIHANPIVVYVNLPVEKHIVFDGLETIINDYFINGDLPSELSALPGKPSVSSVKIDDILTATLEHSLIKISACAAIYVNLQFGAESDSETGEGNICTECFPLSFTADLDFDFNCKTIEYEIDTSEFELKIENIRKTQIPGNKHYISKTRFDTEFKLYQELSENIITMICDIGFFYPAGSDTLPKCEPENLAIFEEIFRKASESYFSACKTINRYAPFFPKKLYELLEKLKNDCRLQIYWYGEFVVKGIDRFSTPLLINEYRDCWVRNTEIIQVQSTVMDFLRTYLENLDVRE